MIFKFLVNTTTLAFIIYSAFNSHKHRKTNPTLKKHYTYYFVVISMYLALDAQLSFLTSFVPFYQFIKLALVVWLSLPGASAPLFIYKFYLNNVFIGYTDKLECFLDKLKEKIKEFFTAKYEQTRKRMKKDSKIDLKDVGLKDIDLKEIESQILSGDLPEEE